MKPAPSSPPQTVDAYIAAFPRAVQAKLRAVRRAIRTAVPAAAESISYRMPAYKLDGPLLYFAAYTAHIGLYPMIGGIKAAFAKELVRYEQSKGTLRLPLDAPIPVDLIARIARFRARENMTKVKKRSRPARVSSKSNRRKPSKTKAGRP